VLVVFLQLAISHVSAKLRGFPNLDQRLQQEYTVQIQLPDWVEKLDKYLQQSSWPSTSATMVPTVPSNITAIPSSSIAKESLNDPASVPGLSDTRNSQKAYEDGNWHIMRLRPTSLIFSMSRAQLPTEHEYEKLVFATNGFVNNVFQVNDSEFRGAQMNITDVTFLASFLASVYLLSIQLSIDLYWSTATGIPEDAIFSVFQHSLETSKYLQTIVWGYSTLQFVTEVTVSDHVATPSKNGTAGDANFDKNEMDFHFRANDESQMNATSSQKFDLGLPNMLTGDKDYDHESESNYSQEQALPSEIIEGNVLDDKHSGSSRDGAPISVFPGLQILSDYLFDAERQPLYESVNEPDRILPSEIICGNSKIGDDEFHFFDGEYYRKHGKAVKSGKSSKRSWSKSSGHRTKSKTGSPAEIGKPKYYGIFGSQGFDCDDLIKLQTSSPIEYTPAPTNPVVPAPTDTAVSPVPSTTIQTTIPTLLHTKQPTNTPTWPSSISLFPSIAGSDTLTTSQSPSESTQPSLSPAPSTSFAPSLSLAPTPRGPTITPTFRDASPSAAPTIPVISIFVPQFSISYVSPGATESPTREEYELLWNVTLEYMEQSLMEYNGNQTDVELLGLSGLLNDEQFEVGFPETRFNLYIESQINLFYTEESNPPTLSEHVDILTDLLDEDYILDCVRNLPVPQFQAVNEIYARAATT
jgi:hypothetical protein